ncbi:MAG: O-antigen ligase family protein [Actinomycetota bacterium]|nr:O-antigen ligase family protein [Actinomycetota bacterium]MDQ3640207.1 O-antigen ligase family protein [Actinomycetota bacterium]
MLAFAALGTITVSRPEIGVAAGLVITSMNPAVAGAPPWALSTLWTVFLLVVALTRWAIERRQQRNLPTLGFVTLLFLAVTIVGLARTPDMGDALPVLRSTATGIAFFFVIASQIRTRRQIQWVVSGASVGALLIGGYATWEYVSGSGSFGFITSSGALVGRVTAGFGHPNQLGGFLLLVLPVAMAGVGLCRRGRSLYLIAVVLAAIGIYASFSRAALVALAMVPLAFLRWRHTLVVVPVLACITLVAIPDLIQERFATLTPRGAEVAGRSDYWRTAGTIWADQPVLGAGLGSFPSAYARTRLAGKQFLPSTALQSPPHAHNLFLQLLAEQGVAGLVALLAVLAASLHWILRMRRARERWIRLTSNALLASLAAFLVHNLFDLTLLERTAVYFWALLGLVSAVTMIQGNEDQLEGAG